MLLVKNSFLTFLFRIKACFNGKSVTFYYELILFEFKSTTATAKIKVWTGRDLSLAYRWIQLSPSFKVYLAGATSSLAYMDYDCKKAYQRNSGVEAYGD
jgi:hypothetical protein